MRERFANVTNTKMYIRCKVEFPWNSPRIELRTNIGQDDTSHPKAGIGILHHFPALTKASPLYRLAVSRLCVSMVINLTQVQVQSGAKSVGHRNITNTNRLSCQLRNNLWSQFESNFDRWLTKTLATSSGNPNPDEEGVI